MFEVFLDSQGDSVEIGLLDFQVLNIVFTTESYLKDLNNSINNTG